MKAHPPHESSRARPRGDLNLLPGPRRILPPPGFAARRVWHTAVCAVSLFASGIDMCVGEIVLYPSKGNPLIAESIIREDDKTIEIEIYRGFQYKVPKASIARREEIDRSQAPERAEFEKRLQAIGTKRKPAEYLALAQWARATGLTVRAMALLTDLKARFPGNAEILAAAPAQAERKRLTEAERVFLTNQVVAFFARDDKSNEVLSALDRHDALPPGTADEWARLCLDEARKGLKLKEGDSKFKFGEFECDLHIERWRKPAQKASAAGDGTAATNRAGVSEDAAWPMVVSLHGGGEGDGHWTSSGPTYLKLFQRHFDKFIFVAPTVMKKNYAEWGANPSEELVLREILRAVKRTWPVDTDRTYLVGYSMGGYGTWHIGGHQADQFAGLESGAGGILLGAPLREAWGWGVVGNLMHTPISFIHGGKDEPAPPWSDAECDRILQELAGRHPGCYRHRYKLYPQHGHGLPGEATAESVAWIAQFTREPYPRKICWEPKRKFNRQFYWLRVAKPQIFTRLEAEIAGNVVRVKTHNINGGFQVLLNRHLADLSKPVTVEIDGRRAFEGRVPETLSTILTTIADRLDERQWFSARIDF